MTRNTIIVLTIAGVAVLGFLFLRQRSGIELPRSGETVRETITVDNKDKEISITDGVKHSVPLDEIISGCPGLDCIPSIDDPKFESNDQAAAWLRDDDLGLALTIDGDSRFYPYRILVSHEIVNDTFNDQRVLVTYCPLCFTAIVFDPLVAGKGTEFGVSGKLRNSNLIMYDRETDSLWSQVTGEAIVGEQTGNKLEIIPSDITKFGLFKEANSNGQVLSRDTGRPFATYSSIPYGGDLTDIEPFFPLTNRDDRLNETAYVLGLVIDGTAKAYNFESVKKVGSFSDTIAGQTVQVKYDAAVDSVTVTSGDERLPTVPAFWFSWAATHPDTELYE